MKKNFVLQYQTIFELTFMIFFLVTYFGTKDYKWLVLWPLFDNFYNYILIWVAHEDQKKWFVDHASHIDPRSRTRPRKKPFGLYLLLEVCKTVVISLCMHSVLVRDDVERIWIGCVLLIVIDVILLGDDALLNVLHYYPACYVILIDVQFLLLAVALPGKSQFDWFSILTPMLIFCFASIITVACIISVLLCFLCLLVCNPKKGKESFTDPKMNSTYFNLAEHSPMIPMIVFQYNIGPYWNQLSGNHFDVKDLQKSKDVADICIIVGSVLYLFKWAILLWVPKQITALGGLMWARPSQEELRRSLGIRYQRASNTVNTAERGNKNNQNGLHESPPEGGFVSKFFSFIPVSGNYFVKKEVSDAGGKNEAAGNAKGDNIIDPEDKMCVICFSKESDTIINACGHGGMCSDCAQEYITKKDICIMCRGEIDMVYVIQRKAGKINVVGTLQKPPRQELAALEDNLN